MKNHLIIIATFFLLVFFPSNLFAEQATIGVDSVVSEYEWFTEHSGSGEEAHGHFILATSDGGYLQIGETGFIPNSAKIIVVKVDANGDFVWRQEFGSAGHNLGNSIIETASAYVLVGSLAKNSAIIQLNKTTGATISSEVTNHGGTDAYEHVAEIASGYVAVGYNFAQDPNNTFYTEGQGLIAFLDTNGQVVNAIDISSDISQAYRVALWGNDIFVAGLSEEALQFTLLKLDSTGSVLWSQEYGGADSEHNFGFDQNAAGEMCLTGHTLSGTANWDTYTVKVDTNGNELWSVPLGNPRGFNPNFIHDEAWGVAATADGGCLVVAGTGDEYGAYSQCNMNGCSDFWQVYLIKFSADGQIEWQKTFTNPLEPGSDWAGEDLTLTLDGKVLIAVDSSQLGFLKVSAEPAQAHWVYDENTNTWTLIPVPTAVTISATTTQTNTTPHLFIIAFLLIMAGAIGYMVTVQGKEI